MPEESATGSPVRILVTTYPSHAVATKQVESILRRKLAACANLIPIDSTYWWKDALAHDKEVAVWFKTSARRVRELWNAIKRDHPYEVPELVELAVHRVDHGYAAYVKDVLPSFLSSARREGGRTIALPATHREARRVPEGSRPGQTRAPHRRRSRRTGTRRRPRAPG